MRALVVGAGLAGLSAAVSLRSAHAEVTVIDRSEHLASGTSIGITARAVDALAELGVLEAAKPHASVLAVPILGRQFDGAGDPLPGPPGPRIGPRPDGLPAAVIIHRSILAGLLVDRARERGVVITRPMQITGLVHDDGGVVVVFADGERERYDLVVGADGVRSQVRSFVIPEATAQYTGQMSLRALIPDMEPGQAGFFQIPEKGFFVAVGLLPGDTTYVATGVRMECRHVEPPEARSLLRGVLDGFTAPYLREVRDRVTEDLEVVVGPYESLHIKGDWFRGRVVLIGDAAHATTPNLSSGGGLALEDGVVLGQEVAARTSIDEALQAFMIRRRDRSDVVVPTSLELMRLSSEGDPEQQAFALRGRAMQTLAQPY